MSNIKALDLRVGDVKESHYGTPMRVYSIRPLPGDAILVQWDFGMEMDCYIATALYSPDRNPDMELKNR